MNDLTVLTPHTHPEDKSNVKAVQVRDTLLQEAHLSPSNRAMRLVSSNLANCHATVQKLLIRQVLTLLMV